MNSLYFLIDKSKTKINFLFSFLFIFILISCSNNDNKIYLTQDKYFNIKANEINIQIDSNVNNNFISYNLDTNINKPIYKVFKNNKEDYQIYLSYSLQTNFVSLKNNILNVEKSIIYLFKQKDDYLFKSYKIKNEYINELTLKLNQDYVNIMVVCQDSNRLSNKFDLQHLQKRISN